MAFGSFDILHPGHLEYLRFASRYGKLIVVVARDSTIIKLKKRMPFIDERSRLKMVGCLRFVDKAVLGNRITSRNGIYKIIRKYSPDYIVLGYDQMASTPRLKRELSRNKIDARIIRARAYNARRFKSSRLAKSLKLSS